MTNRSPIPLPPSHRQPARSRGFILIVSLTLAAFLAVLLLSLTFMIRTSAELAVSGTAEIQARQNALLGLQMGLGQLQKFTGHDQRITIQANFADTTTLGNGLNIPIPGVSGNMFAFTVTNQYVTAGKNDTTVGLPTNLQSGARFWTGVYGNQDAANDSYVKSPTPVLLTWLVSGNESVKFTASPFSFGKIETVTRSAQMPFTPDSAIQGIKTVTNSNSLLTAKITIAGKDGVVLVGPGTASWSSVSTLPELADAFVVAPLVPISISSTLLPGSGSGGGGSRLSGRYAWAVLDEGVKAKSICATLLTASMW